jgi:hypothetical protein
MIGTSRREQRDRHIVRTYYRCMRKARQFPGQPNACTTRYIPAGALDALVWAKTVELLRGPGFEDALREAQAREMEAVAPRKVELAALQTAIKALETRARRLAVEIDQAGPLMRPAFKEQQVEVESQHERMVRRQAELVAKIAAADVLSDTDIAALSEFRADVLAGMEDPTMEDKRRALDVLRAEIKVGHRGVGQIELNLDRANMCLAIGTSQSANDKAQLPLTIPFDLRADARINVRAPPSAHPS